MIDWTKTASLAMMRKLAICGGCLRESSEFFACGEGWGEGEG